MSSRQCHRYHKIKHYKWEQEVRCCWDDHATLHNSDSEKMGSVFM